VSVLLFLLITQLIGLAVAVGLLWAEYRSGRQHLEVQADTLVNDTMVSAAEVILSFFTLVEDDGRPRIIWRAT
jgi:hypothetical protein